MTNATTITSPFDLRFDMARPYEGGPVKRAQRYASNVGPVNLHGGHKCGSDSAWRGFAVGLLQTEPYSPGIAARRYGLYLAGGYPPG